MMKSLTVVTLPVAVLLTQCRPANPKTGIYAQKVLKQSGSCQTITPKPHVLIGVTHNPETLNFIAPMPNGGGAFITIPSSGGEKAVCDDNVTYDAQVAELSNTTIKLDFNITWDAKGSLECQNLASDPALSCAQNVQMQYTFEESCDAPCVAREVLGSDGSGRIVQTTLTCDCPSR